MAKKDEKAASASSRKRSRVTPPKAKQEEKAAEAVVAAPGPTVTVGDADVLDCGVCCLPLRPPIFQCEVGHVVCSACRDKLESTGSGKCHVCGVATRGGGGYRRCFAMEQLVDCTRVACPYAAHGCHATPPYHGLENHRQECSHAPCHCPGESCGFIGSITALLNHFAGAHNWPCTTKVKFSGKDTLGIRLRDGFNFFRIADDHEPGNSSEYEKATTCRLLLLNVTRHQGIGRAISVLCIHPCHASGVIGQKPQSKMQCSLTFSHSGDEESLCGSHYQTSVFKVVCTDLSDGLPSADGCFQFIVPNAHDKDCIQVQARWTLKY